MAPLGVEPILGALRLEALLFSSAFLLTGIPLDDREICDDEVGVVDFSPVMEARSWPIYKVRWAVSVNDSRNKRVAM